MKTILYKPIEPWPFKTHVVLTYFVTSPQRIQYAKQDSDIISKMKGTYVERDRKKEKKKVKGSDGAGSKKGAQGAAASMVAGVPAAMPVSVTSIYFTDNYV